MYLLLALGITLGVLFVGGALLGFVAGFIDGYNEAEPGTTSPMGLVSYGGIAMVLVLCGVLNWVFLHFRFASFGGNRMPREASGRVYPLLMLAMGGLALVYILMYNPLLPYDGTLLTEDNEAIRHYYQLIKQYPLVSLPLMILIEGTADLVLFSAVLREVLEWKHKPEVVIPIFAAVMGLFTGFSSMTMLMVPSMMVALVEAWTYECTRSVVPVIIADVFFWVVFICLLGVAVPAWCYFLAVAIIVPSSYFLVKSMAPFKPID